MATVMHVIYSEGVWPGMADAQLTITAFYRPMRAVMRLTDWDWTLWIED